MIYLGGPHRWWWWWWWWWWWKHILYTEELSRIISGSKRLLLLLLLLLLLVYPKHSEMLTLQQCWHVPVPTLRFWCFTIPIHCEKINIDQHRSTFQPPVFLFSPVFRSSAFPSTLVRHPCLWDLISSQITSMETRSWPGQVAVQLEVDWNNCTNSFLLRI